MVSAIIEIIIGVLIWKVGPKCIEQGKPSTRNTIKLIMNIVGVLIMICGIVSLIKWLV
ncbi:MAG: hypothetical protein LKF31_08265 [Muribaculaceae bacterium]|jgi:hypothetical protein|nr:hypothetical protein [Muribaculaceae bacterium]